MEILELLFAAPEMCGCLFEIITILVDVFAGASTYRYVKARKSDDHKTGTNDDDGSQRAWQSFLLGLLIMGAIVMTTLMVARWIHNASAKT